MKKPVKAKAGPPAKPAPKAAQPGNRPGRGKAAHAKPAAKAKPKPVGPKVKAARHAAAVKASKTRAANAKKAKAHPRRQLALGSAVACCSAEALAASLRLALSEAADVVNGLLGQGVSHSPGERLAYECAGQIADLVTPDYCVDIALVREPGDERHDAGVLGELACPDFYAPGLTVMHGDQVTRALRRNSPEDLIAASHQVNAGGHLRRGTEVAFAAGAGRQRHNRGHGRAHSSVDGPARPSRLAGSIISDFDVLDLYWRTAKDANSGASIQVTLEVAAEFGLGGFRPLSFAPVDLDDPAALILGLALPAPHAVLDTGREWISWGERWPAWAFPDAVIEEAWTIEWEGGD